jgi:hypothetical protein
VFDAQIYSLSIPEVRQAVKGNQQSILDEYKLACVENQPFLRAISTTTKTVDAFLTRHREWQRILNTTCSVEYELPEPLRRN